MTHTTHTLYAAAGSPDYPAPTTGVCRVCGCNGNGVPFDKWVKSTFTNWDRLVPGDILCTACQFSFEEASDLLRERVGKDKPQKMRNYSHFVVGGVWHPLNKGQKREMRNLLPQSQIAVIAESGQKHLVFRAQAGWWQLEEQAMLPDVARWQAVQSLVDALYVGFTKEEITTGRYDLYRIRQFGIDVFQSLESQIAPLRGSTMLQLAVFLAVREETHERTGNARETGSPIVSPDLAGHTGVVQERLPI